MDIKEVDIKEAVEIKERYLRGEPFDVEDFKAIEKADKVFIQFAQSYLNLKGFPEEREKLPILGIEGEVAGNIRIEQDNQLIKECKLAVRKMYSVERIEKLFNDYEWIEFEGRTVLAIHPDEIAQAISNIGEEE